MVNGQIPALTTTHYKYQYLRPKQTAIDEKFSNMKLNSFYRDTIEPEDLY